jgi:hypothetical protein
MEWLSHLPEVNQAMHQIFGGSLEKVTKAGTHEFLQSKLF